MSKLAAFLRAERDAIIGDFTNRIASSLPRKVDRPVIINHLPQQLDRLAELLDRGVSPSDALAADSQGARQHGDQRLREGFDLDQMVSEFGVLRDCIYERLDAREVRPTMRELHVLENRLSASLATSARQFLQERGEIIETQRRMLFGLFEQAPGFLAFLRGPTLIFELENAAYRQATGGRSIIGKPIREALPELAGQGFYELLERVYTTGEPFVGRNMPARLQRTPTGPLEELIIDFVYQPIRAEDGSVIGVLIQGHDMTEVHRQEVMRREAEQQMRTVFDALDDGFTLIEVVYDPNGRPVDYRFLEANPAFESHTGLTDAIGRTMREIAPDMDQFWFDRYGAVADTGIPARFVNHAPALHRWYDVFAMRVGAPERKHVAVVFRDITGRRLAEEERENLLLRERAARKEAEEAGRLRDDFLATVSHELRTPLNAMLGWVQMLRGALVPPDKQAKALETIERNARAQAQLIEDLPDVSRILAGKLRLEIETVDLGKGIDAARDTVQPTALAKGVALEVAARSGLTVEGDSTRLQQIVWNLLANAVKFTPRGGTVRLATEIAGDRARIVVSDTGIGLDAAFLPHVFERFRQANGSTTRSHAGLGLGLAIVKQLVELHGGTVSAASEGIGKGATFVVELPLAFAPREHKPVSGQVPTLSNRRILEKLDVLIVEDDPDTREMLRTMVETFGGRPRVTESVPEAEAAFDMKTPDLLLSDIGLPGEDGYALIERVRKRSSEKGGDVIALALTAYSRVEERTRALEAGFDNHIAKPIDAAELAAAIGVLVRKKRR